MDYVKEQNDLPIGPSPRKHHRVAAQADSDTDFQAKNDTEVEESSDDEARVVEVEELEPTLKRRQSRNLYEPEASKSMFALSILDL